MRATASTPGVAPSRARRRFLGRAVASVVAGACLPRGAAAAAAADATAAAAQGGVARLLCSGPAGSIPDLIARTIAAQLPPAAAGPVVVDNRPGAAGQISVGALKAAPADGATLLLGQGALATVYPFLYPKLGYDPVADLKPVSLACETPLALAVGPAVPPDVATLGDFVAWLRRHPADANIGSPGTGTLPHLLVAMLLREEGAAWQHIAYSGGPPAVTELLGGRLAALALPDGLLRQHHASGRIRVLATSGRTRSADLPDVPTFVELQHPALVVTEWFAFFAPSTTTAGRIDAASAALREAIARPAVALAFGQAGMAPLSSTPSQLAARITAEQRHWAPVLRANGIRADG